MTDSPSTPPAADPAARPSREELQAELAPVPERPEPPRPPEAPGIEQLLSTALSYVRGRRGADLLAVILVGSGAKRALTPHSDLDLIAVVKGKDEGDETIRVGDRIVEVRYREHKGIEQDLAHVPRLPPLLRKGRVLFDLEAVGAKLIEKAAQRFRSGPPPAGMHEKIRLKAECYHRLGKAQDMSHQPALAQYLLGLFLEELLHDFFRLRGFWPTAPTETLRFAASRDAAFGEMLERFHTAPSLADRLQVARDLANHVFRDVPLPQRID